MLIIAIFLVLAFGLFAFITGLDQRTEQARVIRERLAGLEAAAQRNPEGEVALLRDELLSTVPAFNRVLMQSALMLQLQRFISQAGLATRPGKVILICACIGATAATVTNFFQPGPFAFLALALGCAAPLVVITIMRQRRFDKFEELFPPSIELLARSVRAGHSFSVSLEFISSEMAEPVASEFRKVYEEQRFGLPIRDALMNLADRMPLFDMRFFVVALLLQRETGGNLVEILDKLSYVIRERFKIRRQVRVFTAQGRMSMYILVSMPFLMLGMLSWMAPRYAHLLLTDPIGHKLIGLGLVMLTVGYLLIQKIVHIRV
jgi:tight adherence protein B